jgi:hypothetical protein
VHDADSIDSVGFFKHHINSFIVPGRDIFAHDIGSDRQFPSAAID